MVASEERGGDDDDLACLQQLNYKRQSRFWNEIFKDGSREAGIEAGKVFCAKQPQIEDAIGQERRD